MFYLILARADVSKRRAVERKSRRALERVRRNVRQEVRRDPGKMGGTNGSYPQV